MTSKAKRPPRLQWSSHHAIGMGTGAVCNEDGTPAIARMGYLDQAMAVFNHPKGFARPDILKAARVLRAAKLPNLAIRLYAWVGDRQSNALRAVRTAR